MDKATKYTLDMLQRGAVSVINMPTGFRLAARIFDLRDKGYVIHTDRSRKLAGYTLIKSPKGR